MQLRSLWGKGFIFYAISVLTITVQFFFISLIVLGFL